jgi:hypothetical protein
MHPRRTRSALAALALALAVACGGSDTGPPIPARLVANSSTTPSATVDAQVAERPSVTVLDASGAPIGGVAVKFTAVPGHGLATSTDQVTNAAGVATVGTWQLDSIAGVNTLTVTAGGLPPVVFTAIGIAGPPRYVGTPENEIVRAPVASTLTTGAGVLVKDVFMNPVAGVPITFAVFSGGGSVTGASQVTNAAGVASPGGWTLGTTAGSNLLAAMVPGIGTMYLGVTGTPGPAVALVTNGISSQSAIVGRTFPFTPAAGARDAYGNAVTGVPVTFSVTGGNGIVVGTSKVTNEYGFAGVDEWRAGTIAGLNTLQATSGTLRSVSFTATGTPETPATVEKVGGDGQTGPVDTTLPIALSVVVKDKFGNPIAGTGAYFAPVTGAPPNPTSVLTDANGIAAYRWKLTTAVGTQTLNAGIGPAALVFTATATP